MSKKNVHVVPRGSGWAVEKAGASRASKVTETQKEAIGAATKTARREGSEVIIHGANGRIREKNSYGNDPNPPKG